LWLLRAKSKWPRRLMRLDSRGAGQRRLLLLDRASGGRGRRQKRRACFDIEQTCLTLLLSSMRGVDAVKRPADVAAQNEQAKEEQARKQERDSDEQFRVRAGAAIEQRRQTRE